MKVFAARTSHRLQSPDNDTCHFVDLDRCEMNLEVRDGSGWTANRLTQQRKLIDPLPRETLKGFPAAGHRVQNE
jgi:hypothetical protein